MMSNIIMNMNNKEKKRYLDRLNKTNLKFNLSNRIRNALRKSLRGCKNYRYWEVLVGYSLFELKNHLSKSMPKGYTWDDYTIGKLHLDHIIPISAFNYTKPKQLNFKLCWALNNLQLLPSKENIIKSDKLSKPFQLVLAI